MSRSPLHKLSSLDYGQSSHVLGTLKAVGSLVRHCQSRTASLRAWIMSRTDQTLQTQLYLSRHRSLVANSSDNDCDAAATRDRGSRRTLVLPSHALGVISRGGHRTAARCNLCIVEVKRHQMANTCNRAGHFSYYTD